MTFARQFISYKTLYLPKADSEFIKNDPCLNCLFGADCNESHPSCGYQNSLDVRTVPVDPILTMPLALRMERERLRGNWAMSKRVK